MASDNTIISVIVPVYNAEKDLKRCLNSIIGQTYKDLQIILVNDGSLDLSLEICEEYAQKDNRIQIVNQKNSGVGRARNKGLDLAIGKYVSFIDADDWLDENYYLRAVEAGMFELNPDVVWFGHIDEIERDLFQWKKVKQIECCKLENAVTYMNDSYIRYLWNKLYKTDLAVKIKFTDKYSYGEDSAFVLKYTQQVKTCMMIDQVFYHYCLSDNALSGESLSTPKYKKDMIAFGQDMVKILNNKKDTSNTIRELYVQTDYVSWIFFQLIENIYHSTELQKSRKKRMEQYQKIFEAFDNSWSMITPKRRKRILIIRMIQARQFMLLDLYYRLEKNFSKKIQKYLL